MLFVRYIMFSVICIGTMVLPSFSRATADVWTLERILSRAVENAPLLKASEKNVESHEEWARQAGRWDNPSIGVTHGSYTELGVRGTATNLSFMQSVPIFGEKRIERKIGDQGKLLAESERDIQKLFTHHEVAALTYRLTAILEQEKHITHRRERLGLITRYLRSRPFASPSQAIEKNLIENRMRDIEEKFVQILFKKEEAWQHLNVYLGLDAPIVPQVQWYTSKIDVALPNADGVFERSPELARQTRLVSLAELELEREGKKIYPNIRLGAGHYDQEVGSNIQTSYVGMVELSVPLWNRGTNARNAARAQSEMQKYILEHKRREASSNLHKSIIHFKETQRKLELYPPSLVETLEKQMHSAEANWKKGLVNATAFLELENQVHEQTDRIYDVQVEYVQALSHLQLLTGQGFLSEKQ